MNTWNSIKANLSTPSLRPDDLPDLNIKGKRCPACNRFSTFESHVVCPSDGTLLIPTRGGRSLEPVVPQLKLKRYKLNSFLGEGDLTTAYLASDVELSTTVVIKILHSHLLSDLKTIKRFKVDQTERSKLNHPQIAPILDTGGFATQFGFLQPYVVMEQLQGDSIKNILRSSGRLPPNVVAHVIIEACAALQHASSEGFLHRDLKPSNLYLTLENDDLACKVVDFGMAERMFRNLEWTDDAARTRTGSIYGNPTYVCPDIIFGAPPTVQSEIYSLGCTMYHALKGMPPFEGNNDFDTLMKHRDKEPNPFVPELKIPCDLEAIILRCLSKEPAERYLTFDDLADALRATSLAEAH